MFSANVVVNDNVFQNDCYQMDIDNFCDVSTHFENIFYEVRLPIRKS